MLKRKKKNTMQNLHVSELFQLAGLFQGILIGILLFLIKIQINNKSICYVGFFILLYTAPFVSYFFKALGFFESCPNLLFLPFGFYFIAIPVYYIYVKSIVSPLKVPIIAMHLLLGTAEFLFFLFLFCLPVEKTTAIYSRFSAIIKFIYAYELTLFCLFYLCLSLHAIKKYRNKMVNIDSNIDGIWLIWLKNITIFLIILYTFQLINITILVLNFYSSAILIINAIAAIIFIYWVSISGLRQIPLTIPIPVPESKSISETESISISISETETEKIYQKVYDKAREVITLEQFNEIQNQIKSTELYKNSDISIYILSETVKIPARKLSASINLYSQSNFNTFINLFRIENAKTMLKNKDYDFLTIEAIARESGFNSKSVFNSLFKKETEMTPLAFKNYWRKKNAQ